ncbi:MAG TPA: lipopolysaccharide heptosyltransferase II [Blastocatellia bacterium]|nr:lipopolysaccharide heptosyltransferase II [Blastocatellia bacterium]
MHSGSIERIFIRGTSWLGDAVMTLPALRRLRAAFPAAHLTLLATPRTAELFTAAPFVEEVIEYRRREAGLRAFAEAVKTMRARRYDLALLFQNAFEAALLAFLGGARLRIGYAAQGRSALLTHPLHHTPDHRNRHQTLDYLDIVIAAERACGLNPNVEQNTTPSLTATASHRSAAAALLERHGIQPGASGQPLIALNTGATNSRAKCWPADRYAALADRLADALNARLILIGAPSEREHAAQVIAQMQRARAVNLAGETNLNELIGVLDRAALLITNDTGPAHIAAALGRPTLTIFGPTNEFETAPLGVRAEIVRAPDIACARCMHRDCPIDHRCMTNLTAEDLLRRAVALLHQAEGKG